MRILGVLLMLMLLTGCASTSAVKTIEVTGESIAALGNTFAVTATAMTNGCLAKRYNIATCSNFRTFGQKFQASYPLAKSLWNAAAAAGDQAMTTNAQNTLTQLSSELSLFTAIVLGGGN